MLPNRLHLPVEMLTQPDEISCGPTCLHAIYNYWGDNQQLRSVVSRTQRLKHGGTLAVFLACDALKQGYRATIYTYNLLVFDPTWFARPPQDIAACLQAQQREKSDVGLQHATEGYLEFMRLGGQLRFVDLSRYLIRGILRRKLPILTGLSSTYLYRTAREYGPLDTQDPIRGFPAGHFVVIAGYDRNQRTFLVADPYNTSPLSPNLYWVNVDRVVAAILLGIVTHDANLLVLRPPTSRIGKSA